MLRAGRYWVPMWYASTHRLALWDVYGRPASPPKYDLGAPATWWFDGRQMARSPSGSGGTETACSPTSCAALGLMIPTLFGIMLITFTIVQFAPGGPVERVLSQLQGQRDGAMSRVTGGSGDLGRRQPAPPAAAARRVPATAGRRA